MTEVGSPSKSEQAYSRKEATNAAETMGGNALGVLWRLIAAYRGRMYLAMSLGIASALCQIIPPFAARGITAALEADMRSDAFFWASTLLAGALAVAILFAGSTYISHLIAADVMRDQRRLYGEKLTRVPLGFFQVFSIEELRKILVDDTEHMEDGIAHLIPELTAALVGPLAMLAFMFVLDWRLALPAALPTVVGVFLMSSITRYAVDDTNAFYAAQAKIAASMSEVVSAIPLVKTYNNSGAAIKRADISIRHFHSVINAFVDKSIAPTNWLMLCATSNLLLLTPMSIWLMEQEAVALPEVVFFHLAALSLALLLSALFGVSNRLTRQENVVSRRERLLSQPEQHFVSGPGAQPKGYDVTFENVSFAYENSVVIDGIDLNVPAGSTLALVGPSGAGKTTLARLLARFWDVSSGQISVGGADVRAMTPETSAKTLSFVFQDVFLFSRSVADNIRMANPTISDTQLQDAAKAAQAHAFIMDLPEGYDTVLDGHVDLSLGQRQRLCIARALVQDSPVLVLDEAMAFADPENEREVQNAISSLCAGKTVIVIAHRLSTIQHTDQIAFIKDGKVAELGDHESLLAQNGPYAAQWRAHKQAQSFVIGHNQSFGAKEGG